MEKEGFEGQAARPDKGKNWERRGHPLREGVVWQFWSNQKCNDNEYDYTSSADSDPVIIGLYDNKMIIRKL